MTSLTLHAAEIDEGLPAAVTPVAVAGRVACQAGGVLALPTLEGQEGTCVAGNIPEIENLGVADLTPGCPDVFGSWMLDLLAAWPGDQYDKSKQQNRKEVRSLHRNLTDAMDITLALARNVKPYLVSEWYDDGTKCFGFDRIMPIHTVTMGAHQT
jgi:hypothetical protein